MDRRHFLRHALLAGSAAALPWRTAGAALNLLGKGLPDYKALVCVFLNGGNDAFNMIVPTDSGGRAAYRSARGDLALPLANQSLLPLDPLAAPAGGGEYGWHPGMEGLRDLFASGRCAMVANVGPLLYPISKSEFENESVPVPPQLFSHSDQQLAWDTAWPDSGERTGWAGRVADLLRAAGESSPIPSCLSLDGANTLQVGREVQPYFISPWGTESLFFIEGEWQQSRRDSFLALQRLGQGNGSHLFERAYGRVMQRALDNHALVSNALATTPTPATAFPDSWLGQQLAMVARLIAARSALGMSRQIFYVTQHGYDTHSDQLSAHAELLADLSNCLAAMHAATVELGVEDAVTSFTASEFGRTVSVNGDGTDHGWGGHQLVVGGAVRGQRIYGRMPTLSIGGPDDVAWGQIIPSTATDQYVATLARWIGVGEGDIGELITPNLARFGGGSPYLDFLG